MRDVIVAHWPEYLMEGALLACFMISACLCAALLEHPASFVRRMIPAAAMRRAVMGIAMGITAILLIYSPWGQQSGAHMNPATTLTFFLRGKVAPWDAFFYITAQFIGGVLGVGAARAVLRDALRHAAVNHVVTVPGFRGSTVAWAAELAISFGMMLTVLLASNDAMLAPYTGFAAGLLLALFILLEAPLSGTSLNPARSFGSALLARKWTAFWVYLTAPVAGMLLAAAAYGALPVHNHVYCAKLAHCNDRRCIFRCEFDQLRARGATTGAPAGRS